MNNPSRYPKQPRKRIRLDPDAYAVPGAVWHVSIGTELRRPVLRDTEMAAAVVESIQFHCNKGKANLLLYCVMPEHFHLVVSVLEVDLITILHDFKSWTTTVWRKRSGQRRLWQDSFYDHGIRRTESMDDLIAYVTENPVKEGLVADWRDYTWLGGTLLADDSDA